MTIAHLFIAVSIAVALAYGFLVYLTNPKRAANQQFFTLTLVLALWMICVWQVLNATGEATALWWLRAAFITSQLVPTCFNLLRIAINSPDASWLQIAQRSRGFLAANVLVGALCLTDFFASGIRLPGPDAARFDVAEPVYGPGFLLFNLYYLFALGWLLAQYAKDARRASGVARTEYQFVLLGCGACIVIGISLAMIIPAITGSSRTAPMAPACAIALNAIIAYGIATKRILGVAQVLRRVTAYGLLTIYLVLLYIGVNMGARAILGIFFDAPELAPNLLAAIAVAFSLAPANGLMQDIARRLFININTLDVAQLVQRVSGALQSISTVDELLRQFTDIIRDKLGVDRVLILLGGSHEFAEIYPRHSDSRACVVANSTPIVKVLRRNNQPFVVDVVRRQRLSPLIAGAADDLSAMNVAAAVGLRVKGRLTGIMLLGPRLSGRIYGASEERALQLVCNELAVALENAKLYTEARNSRIYNDILLDSLGTGVVAANHNHIVTVFNRDAQRILDMPAGDVIGRRVDVLPAPLARALRETFLSETRRQDEEVLIAPPTRDRLYLRVGGSVFHGHTGEILGALIVLHDVTGLKALQSQIRRSDRLASMGTLSAGMAHEIKNPLVTIKTFTQLLPERYDDPEFRDDFVSLVSEEVKRIDSLVNQLLSFSRPSKPSLSHVHMHTVIDDSLRLVRRQLDHSRIVVSRDYRCPDDLVLGDADLLSQAFVNFFLNARDAMETGGTLTIGTSLIQNSRAARRKGDNRLHARKALLIRIEDTGVGIREDDLLRVFDPFFTTKSNGTGLGLAVAHGIIEEQGGVIDVKSEERVGTSFLIDFPLPKTENGP